VCIRTFRGRHHVSRSPAIDFSARLLVLAALALLCFELPVAHAQSGISDIHIEPGVQSIPRSGLSNRDLGTIRTHTELVLVPVTVTDLMNRVVAGLEQENFQLYEDK
jgi:hypothetical protein